MGWWRRYPRRSGVESELGLMSMTASFDRTKSLQEFEGRDWSEPTYQSYLVQTLHRLWSKPINDFSVEDLRIWVLQGVGPRSFMPLAVERLAQNLKAEGEYYPGDLLCAVLRVEASLWSQHPTMQRQVHQLLLDARARLPLADVIESRAIEASFAEAEKEFSTYTQHLS
jgi:hypothetical protein